MNGVGFILPFTCPEVIHACSPAWGQAATSNHRQWLLAPALPPRNLSVHRQLYLEVWGHARTPRRAHKILNWNLTLGTQAWRDLYDLNKNNFVAFCSSLFMEWKCTYIIECITKKVSLLDSLYFWTKGWALRLPLLGKYKECVSNSVLPSAIKQC